MKTYNVIIADDSERARQAIRMVLQAEPKLQIVAEATSGQEVLQLAKQLIPDLILMDINMPELDGLQATRHIKREFPYIYVVILSVSDDPADLFEAIRSGAQGYLVKSLDPHDWILYLQGILEGDTPISSTMAKRLLSEFKASAGREAESTSFSSLTTRENEILELVSQGATNREIANQLFIAENTVKNHLKNIMSKLHIKNRVQLATYVTSRGESRQLGSARGDELEK